MLLQRNGWAVFIVVCLSRVMAMAQVTPPPTTLPAEQENPLYDKATPQPSAQGNSTVPAGPGDTAPATAPANTPATQPSSSGLTEEDRVKQIDALFKHLSTKVYGRDLTSKDWVTRCLAVISLAQLPHPKATDQIIEALSDEKNPVARCVLWQAMLSRAPLLTPAQAGAWERETLRMISRNDFGGDLRIAVLEFLATRPLSPEARKYASSTFAICSALEVDDLPTLRTLGEAIRAWGDAKLVTSLIDQMGNPNASIRSQFVLRAAGADVPLAASVEVRKQYQEWWKKTEKSWASTAVPADAYRTLKPQYIAPPLNIAKLDPFDKKWRQEVELGPLTIDRMDFCIALDHSGSMGSSLVRMKRDAAMLFAAISAMSRQTRVGFIGFSGNGKYPWVRLTENARELTNFLSRLPLEPGGDEEYGPVLMKLLHDNPWDKNISTRRSIIMISDESLNSAQQDAFRQAFTQANEGKVNVYMGLVVPFRMKPNEFMSLPTNRTGERLLKDDVIATLFDKMPDYKIYKEAADATHGQLIDLWGVEPEPYFLDVGDVLPTVFAPEPTWIPPLNVTGDNNVRLIEAVLLDAVKPECRERLKPLIRIVIAYAHNARPQYAENRTNKQPQRRQPGAPIPRRP